MTPSFEITLSDGVQYTLKYPFLAFRELGLNPFKPRELYEFLGFGLDEQGLPHIDLSQIDAEKAARWVRAGMAWEHVEGEAKAGKPLPSVEWVLSRIDKPEVFLNAFSGGMEAAGLKGDGNAEAKLADPPTA